MRTRRTRRTRTTRTTRTTRRSKKQEEARRSSTAISRREGGCEREEREEREQREQREEARSKTKQEEARRSKKREAEASSRVRPTAGNAKKKDRRSIVQIDAHQGCLREKQKFMSRADYVPRTMGPNCSAPCAANGKLLLIVWTSMSRYLSHMHCIDLISPQLRCNAGGMCSRGSNETRIYPR